MRWRTALATLAGAALVGWLLWRSGLADVGGAIERFGLPDFLLLVVFQLALGLMMGGAWALLGAGRPDFAASRYLWGRLVRDAAAQALPFSQVGAAALGGRALAIEGVDGAFATASTISDLAVEFAAEVAFVALGAVLLTQLAPHAPLGRPILVVLGILVAMAAALIMAQAQGAPLVERTLRRLTSRAEGDAQLPVTAAFAAIRRRPLAVAEAFALHLAGWLLGAVQTWLTLRWLGAHVDLGGALVVDSLTAGAKAAGFLVPASVGVQEAALVLLGAAFGVGAPEALALSLLRRGRDLVLAVPVLAAWQARRGERIWRLGAH